LWWLSAAMAAESQVVVVDPEQVEVGVLAKQWEASAYIRDRLRTNESRLVAWPMDPKNPNRELTGQPTMAGIAKNVHALTLLATWWCPRQTKAKTPSIAILRAEVWLNDQHGCFRFFICIHVSFDIINLLYHWPLQAYISLLYPYCK